MRRFIATGVLIVFLVPATPVFARERDSRATPEGAPGQFTRTVVKFFTRLVQPKNPSAKNGVVSTLGDWLSPPVP